MIRCVTEQTILIFLRIFIQLIKYQYGLVNKIYLFCKFLILHLLVLLTAKQETYDDQQTKSREIRFLHRLSPSTTNKPLAREHYANHQQMDAENRLQQLEVVRPSENINLLNAKFRVLQHPRHARPISSQYRDDYVNTFYDQIGTYVQERSGLYHTENYKPETLVQAMPELENYKENKTISGDENNLVDVLYATEQTQNRVKPALFQYRAIGDYQNMRVSLFVY